MMFCNSCGAQIAADQRFCGACGKPVIQPPAAVAATPSVTGRLAHHLRTLAILWIAFSALRVLKGFGSFVGARVLRGVGGPWMDGVAWGWSVPDFVPRILFIAGFGFLFLAIGGFIAGWGLLERQPWARTLTIVLAVIALFHPVLGTALGIYTLWVLLPGPSEAEWRTMASA
jgi:hypothetical protein